MSRLFNIAMLIVITTGFLSACVELKQAGRTVGHTSRDVAKDIGHASRDIAKGIGGGAKRVMTEAEEDEEG